MDAAFSRKVAAMMKVAKWGEGRESECMKGHKIEMEKCEKEQNSIMTKLESQQKQEKSQHISTLTSYRKSQEKAKNEEIKIWNSKRKSESEQRQSQLKVELKSDKSMLKKRKSEVSAALKIDLSHYNELQHLILKHELEMYAIDKERMFQLQQNQIKKETHLKGMDARHAIELAYLDRFFILQVQNLQKSEVCRGMCVELLRPVVMQLVEEKRSLDFMTMERFFQSEVADLKKKQALRRKQMTFELQQKKKIFLAEHKQNMKAIKKGGKEQKSAEKTRYEREIAAAESSMTQECDDKDRDEDAALTEEQRRRKHILEDNWKQQANRLEGRLNDLARPLPVPTYRSEKNKIELNELIQSHKEETFKTLETYHTQRSDLLQQNLSHRLSVYRSNCDESRSVLNRMIQERNEDTYGALSEEMRSLLSDVGSFESHLTAEGEELTQTESLQMKNEGIERESGLLQRHNDALVRALEIPEVGGAPLPKMKG
jgi:hypothetical protein